MTADYGRPAGSTPRYSALIDQAAYLMLCGFLFSIPWEQSPEFGTFPYGHVLAGGALGLALLGMGVTGKWRHLSRAHYLMATLVALSTASLMWTADADETLERAGTYLQLLVVVWLIWEIATTEKRIVGLLRAYLFGILLTSLLTIYNFATGITTAELDATRGVEQWEQTRFSIVGINENDLGLMLAMSIPMTIYLIVRVRNLWARLFLWAQLGVCVTAILLTGSRGAFLSTFVASLMLPLAMRRMPRSQQIMAGVACAVVILGAIAFIPADTWHRLFQTGTQISEGTLTHRTLIWSAGLGVLRDHPFLGVGSGAYAASTMSVVGVPWVAHNTFLSVLVELGVFGALLLIALLVTLFLTTRRMPYLEKSLWLTILLTWSLGVMALTWEYRKPTWIMFGLLVAHAYVRRGRNRKPAAIQNPIAAYQVYAETRSYAQPSVAVFQGEGIPQR